MSAARCAWCAKPSTDAVLCHECTRLLRRALVDLAAYLPDLDVTVARQDRVTRAVLHTHDQAEDAGHCERCSGGPVVHTLVARPLPFDVGASDLRAAVSLTLMSWVAELAGRNHIGLAGNWRDPGRAAVEWLRANVRAIRQDQAAREVLRDLLDAARRVERMIDRRDPEVYAGKCDAPDRAIRLDDGSIGPATDRVCGVDLYARFGDTHVTCQACGYRYDVADRQAWLLEQVRDIWQRPSVIAAALTSLNMPLNQNRLDQWISRDRRWKASGQPWRKPYPPILQVGTDYVDEEGRDVMVQAIDRRTKRPLFENGAPVMVPAGHALYRVGDVIDRLTSLAQLEQAKQAAV